LPIEWLFVITDHRQHCAQRKPAGI